MYKQRKNMNNKSQFMHLELYSRTGLNYKNVKKTSAAGVVKEAIRLEGFCSHLEEGGYQPQKPTYLFSQNDKTLDEHYKELEEKVAIEKDALGRKIKADKNILLAGVVSFPKPLVTKNSDAKNQWTKDDDENYDLFKVASLEFLQKKFGDNLMCVLEHTDEEYPHLHFYIADKKKVSNTPRLHPGQAKNIEHEKKSKSENVSVNKKQMSADYKLAMRNFQDEYFNQVGIYCGFDRLGPKVQRLSRAEWKERKRVNSNLATAVKRVKSDYASVQVKSVQLEKSIAALDVAAQQILEKERKLNDDYQKIEKSVLNLEFAEYMKKKDMNSFLNFKLERVQADSQKSQKAKIR
jgi:hypothetical protein